MIPEQRRDTLRRMTEARLTPRQHEVLAFIQDEIARKGYPPTTRELAAACGLGTPSAAHRMIGVLEGKGYLTRTPGTKRAITINPPRVDNDRLPPELLEILATAVGWQDVAVERSLEAAQEARDADIRSTLIRDALERHELTTQICRSVGAPELRRREGPEVEELRWFRQRVPWAYFVVDHLVYNLAVSVGTQQLEGRIPELARLWDSLRRLADSAARQSEGWLAQITSAAPADELARLRNRAEYLLEMMGRTARNFDQDPFLEVDLPEALRPEPG
jgi:hypothetical protein